MIYSVEWSLDAESDLDRLFDHLLTGELTRDDGDLDHPAQAIETIQASAASLTRIPFNCRKAEDNPFLRELLIPLGRTGYVALFEIVSSDRLVIAAVRHQREDDYH